MITFLTPLFLGAASMAMVPLVLHLMARRQTVRMNFSTVRFLKMAQKQSSTKVRMENFLLWLLRTLLMLLLAFAFARPVARLTGSGGFGSLLGASRRDVAIVWDGSYSMTYELNDKTVWDASKEAIISIIHGLSKGDRVSVFLAADTVIPVIGEPTSDLDFAVAAVKGQEFHYTPSSLSDGVVAALDSIKNSGNEREVYVVTDGQSSAWDGFRAAGKAGDAAPAATPVPDASPALSGGGPRVVSSWDPDRVDKNIPVFVSLLGARAPVNTAPVSVEVQPPLIMTDTSPELLVNIGHSGQAQQSSVTLFVDDREVVRRSVDLQPDAGFNLLFTIPPMAPGVHAVRVQTADDPLMLDNNYMMLLKVRQNVPILVVGNEADTFFLSHALAPSEVGAVKTERISPDQVAAASLDNYPCVFLVNALPLSGQAISALQEYVHRGGVLAIFPGDKAKPEDYNAFSCLPADVEHVQDNVDSAGRESLVLLEPLDPLFAGLKMPAGVSPGAVVQRRLTFGKLNPGSKALLGASSENPFLLGRTFGAGRVLLFAVSADRQWSDLPLSPFFLPLIHQTVRLACGIGQDRVQVQPSSSGFVLSDVTSQVPEGATLIGPDHTSLPIRKVQKAGQAGDYALIVDNVSKPGYYFLSQTGPTPPEPLMAVNLDRAESDMKPIAPEDIAKVTGLKNVTVSTSADELQRQIQEHRVGRPLSEVTLWLVLVLAALELYVANRACRKRATLSDSMTVNASGRVIGKALEAVGA